MLILAVETSGNVGSVAVADGERLLRERSFEKGMIHGRALVPSIRDLLRDCGIDLQRIDLIAVDIGPGSYTGLRVGLATAKGLAYALGKEIVGVSSLDAMAENADGRRFLCPMIDARWKQVYTARYEVVGGKRRKVENDRAALPEEVLPSLNDETIIFGDGAARYREVFGRSKAVEGPADWGIPRASHIARLGAWAHRDGRRDDLMRLAPHYLRPTEAEVKKGLHREAVGAP